MQLDKLVFCNKSLSISLYIFIDYNDCKNDICIDLTIHFSIVFGVCFSNNFDFIRKHCVCRVVYVASFFFLYRVDIGFLITDKYTAHIIRGFVYHLRFVTNFSYYALKVYVVFLCKVMFISVNQLIYCLLPHV